MENFFPHFDADNLQNAIKTKKDKDKIIEIICNRTNEQRQKIKEIYNSKYNSDLIKDLRKLLHSHFEDVVIGLFYTPIDYDCFQLRKAVKGLGTDEEALIEILATRNTETIEQIKKRYSEMYPGRTLIKDIESDTSGHFRKLLISLLSVKRPVANNELDYEECEKCAKELYEAGEKKLGTDEDVFIKIFTEKSTNEFVCIAQLYYKLTKKTLLQAVEKEFSMDSKKCLIAIIYGILNPTEYFAKRINQAVKGLGTDDSSLIRIIISRYEIDMFKIRQYYKKLFGKDLINDIKDDTSGNYRKILVDVASR